MSPREPRQGWGGEVKSLQFCIREKKCILNIYKPIKRPIFIPNFLEATCEARLRSFEVCQFKKPFKGPKLRGGGSWKNRERKMPFGGIH